MSSSKSNFFSNTPIFVIAYILLMILTYILPWLGSNSSLMHAGAASIGKMNPGFIVHLIALLGLCYICWQRGIVIGKSWLVIFPILALVFDLIPGLNMIPFVPTIMHILAIILGVIGTTQTSNQS